MIKWVARFALGPAVAVLGAYVALWHAELTGAVILLLSLPLPLLAIIRLLLKSHPSAMRTSRALTAVIGLAVLALLVWALTGSARNTGKVLEFPVGEAERIRLTDDYQPTSPQSAHLESSTYRIDSLTCPELEQLAADWWGESVESVAYRDCAFGARGRMSAMEVRLRGDSELTISVWSIRYTLPFFGF